MKLILAALVTLALASCVATTDALNNVAAAQERLKLVQMDQESTVEELTAAQVELDGAILAVKEAGEQDVATLKAGAKNTVSLMEGILGGGGILGAALGLGARALMKRDQRKALGQDPLEGRIKALEASK